jgi:type I restriction enzyme S subunit
MNESLPKDWLWKPLGELAEVVSGGTPSKNEPAFWEGGTIPWATPSDITKTPGRVLLETGDKITDLGLSASAARKLPIGSVLMTSRATLGEARVAGVATATNQGFKSLIPKVGVDSWYLFYQIQNSKARYSVFGKGTTFLEVNTKDTLRLPIPHCPPPQQRRIATILTTLDEVIEATEKLVEKHQQIKAGLMHDLFTRGLWTREELARGDHKGTPAEATAQEGHLRPTPEEAPGLFQDSPLGLIPKSWRVDSIGSVFEIQLGKMLNKLAKSGRYSATYLGNRAVQWDRIDPSSLEEMDFSPSEREKFSLKFGDLLICEGGDVGRTAMWRGEIENCYYQKAIHRLRPKSDEVIPDFMLRFMRYAKDSGHFANFTSQSSIAHLTQEKLASIPMLVPPPEEQRQLVIRFESIDSKLEAENTHLTKLRQQKQGLMHDLLTGRVRVE